MKNVPTLLAFTSAGAILLAGYLIHATEGNHNPAYAGATKNSNAATTTLVATDASASPTVSKTNAIDNVIDAAQSPAMPATTSESDIVDMNPNYPTLDHRLTEMQARRNGESFDADKVKAALSMNSPWSEDARVMSAFSGQDANQEDGRAFIRYEPLRVEALMPGDELSLPIPQESQEFRMVVETVEAHGDGVVTWRGHLKDFTEQNQVTISQANGNTQMGIFTPDAHYQVEIFGNKGWVVNSGHLFKGGDVVINVTDGVEGPAIHHGEHGETTE